MTLAELQSDCLFLANTVLAQYKADDIKRNLNLHYDSVVLNIWNYTSDWEFDDTSDEKLPIADTNLVSGQWDYSMPTRAREIIRVEVKEPNGGMVKLHPINQNQIKRAREDFKGDDGVPRYYELVGKSLLLYPAPSYNMSEGLSITMSRSVIPLDESTDEPEIEREFHRLLSYGAALDWAIAKGKTSKRSELEREYLKLKRKLSSFYSKRNKDSDIRITTLRQSYD